MRKILLLFALVSAVFADREIEIYVEKIHCPLCTQMVRKALSECDGVISARVDLSSKTASVLARDDADTKAMLEAIAKTTYEGKIVSDKRK